MLVLQITHGVSTCSHPVILVVWKRWYGWYITTCPTDGNGLTAVTAKRCIGAGWLLQDRPTVKKGMPKVTWGRTFERKLKVRSLQPQKSCGSMGRGLTTVKTPRACHFAHHRSWVVLSECRLVVMIEHRTLRYAYNYRNLTAVFNCWSGFLYLHMHKFWKGQTKVSSQTFIFLHPLVFWLVDITHAGLIFCQACGLDELKTK